MKEITDITELKTIELDLLKKVHAFCKERGIRCYLSGGTMLGAVRHKGFIPWDDDVDVMMPRPDYERFCREFSAPDASVHTFKNDPDYFLPFAKVYDDRTILVEDRDPKGRSAVGVDVFPIDGLADRDTHPEKLLRAQRRCYAFLSLRRAPPLFRRRSLRKQLAHWLGAPLRLVPSFVRKALARRALRRLDGVVSSLDFDSAPFAGVVVWGYGLGEVIPQAGFASGVEIPFEDGSFFAMAGWKDYLSGLYGDYMTPPPPEKRVTHHDFRAWWKQSEN